jgi:hypothetical protein
MAILCWAAKNSLRGTHPFLSDRTSVSLSFSYLPPPLLLSISHETPLCIPLVRSLIGVAKLVNKNHLQQLVDSLGSKRLFSGVKGVVQVIFCICFLHNPLAELRST